MKIPVTWNVLYGLLIVVLASSAGGTKFCSWWYKIIPQCTAGEFQCLNGEKCISRGMYCNSVTDCEDNSDEAFCDTHNCPEKLTRCTGWSVKCIPKEWICDGSYDCSDHTDEANCRRSNVRNTVALETPTTVTQGENARHHFKRWIINQKKVSHSSDKWGPNVDRLALSLYLSDDPSVLLEKAEMVYELNIQMLLRFSSMKLEDIPSTELASFVNAFLVTCINPRKFHGYDIVKELRNRANQENYTNPYVFLALCNAGETITESDKNKLIDIFENKHRTFWTDMQAVVVMALACANKQPGNEVDSETLREMTSELKQQQYRNGTVVNLPTTALVMQALISVNSESDPDNFDEVRAFQELLRNQMADGSFGDLMNTFLVIPVLTCKSLADINSTHCQYESTDEISALENLLRRKGPKNRVQYSLWIGNDRNLERNLILRVPQNMSLYAVMETAAEIDSRFKFEYSVKDRKPYINAISGMRDNPLTGKFWFLYTVQNEQHKLSNESPADIIPKDNDHFVMWYRRGTWVDGSS